MNEVAKIANTPTGQDPTGGINSLMSVLQEKLINSSSIISSEDTNLEKMIGNAVSSIKENNTNSNKVIDSKFNREIGVAKEDQAAQITNQLEQGRGFAINIGALRKLTETTDKEIKDLEQRKQELMMQGDVEASKQITDLQIKAYELRANSIEKTFSNLLSYGSLLINAKNAEINANKTANADTSITEVNGRKLLVDNKTGATVKDLGAITKTSTGEKPTEGERRQATINGVASLFSPGHTIPKSGGVPFIDADGYATPEGWKEALKVSGLPRKDFIEQFGYLIYNAGGNVSDKFGLTPQEKKLIAQD